MKKTITLFIFIIFNFACLILNAQVPNWEWARTANGSPSMPLCEGADVTTDESGNAIFCGDFTGTQLIFGTDTLSRPVSTYTGNVFLVKYNPAGNVLWAKCSDTRGYGSSVATDRFKNIYMSGVYYDTTITFGTYTLTNNNPPFSGDIFLAKYDSLGNVLWAVSAGGTDDDYGYSVATDASGNVFISGRFESSSINFGPYTLTNPGASNVFLAKYSSSGNLLWAKCPSANGNSYANGSVATDALGNVYIAGSFNYPTLTFSPYILTNADTSHYDIFLVKYDTNGNVVWATSEGSAGTEESANSICVTNSGIVITGLFTSPAFTVGNTTLSCPTGYCTFIIKFDISGNPLWAKQSTTTPTIGWSVVCDSLGNIYNTGSETGTNGILNFDTVSVSFSPSSPEPMFIVKYDSFGNALWAKTLNGGGDDQNAVAVAKSGDIYVAGDFLVNPLIVGFDTLVLTCAEAPFIAKLSHPSQVGIPESDFSNNQLQISPNPTTSSLTIQTDDNKLKELLIYNVLGELVKQTSIPGYPSSYIIDVSELKTGMYFVEVSSNKGLVRAKFIKE